MAQEGFNIDMPAGEAAQEGVPTAAEPAAEATSGIEEPVPMTPAPETGAEETAATEADPAADAVPPTPSFNPTSIQNTLPAETPTPMATALAPAPIVETVAPSSIQVDQQAPTEPSALATNATSAQVVTPAATPAPTTAQAAAPKAVDEREVQVGATTALLISELHWWITDDDLRGWANSSKCEEEIKDITFNEHKINGKSKGQAYMVFTSLQAATAVRRKIENITSAPNTPNKYLVMFTNPNVNPFKTNPKDGPMRYNSGAGPIRSIPGPPASFGGGFRGRGGYVPRGGHMNAPTANLNRNDFHQNHQQQHQAPGQYQNFNSGHHAMQPFNSSPHRGGMTSYNRGGSMGMRGGRGGGMMNAPAMNPMTMGMAPNNGGMNMNPNAGMNPNLGMGQNPSMTAHMGMNATGMGMNSNVGAAGIGQSLMGMPQMNGLQMPGQSNGMQRSPTYSAGMSANPHMNGMQQQQTPMAGHTQPHASMAGHGQQHASMAGHMNPYSTGTEIGPHAPKRPRQY